MAFVYDSMDALPPGLLASCAARSFPNTLLMCPPTHFDVVDVKNPHMEGMRGRVDRADARRQWEELRRVFARCGARVETIEPLTDCEDMVFCANQTLVGIDAAGVRTCLLSRMKHPSRRREVPPFAEWFAEHGYRVVELATTAGFEGGGDAIWHPGRTLLWGGYGFRTDPQVYEAVSETFGVPVLRLHLHSDRFYHLDTSFCAIDERTALISAAAFDERGLALIRAVFDDVIESDADESRNGLACNATAIGGKHVVIHEGNPRTVAELRARGFEVHEVNTSEFLKSGGSVYCMKQVVF